MARVMQHQPRCTLWPFWMRAWAQQGLTAVGFEPTPLWTGAFSQRLRPLGQTVMLPRQTSQGIILATEMTSRIAGSGSVRAQLSAAWRAPACPLRNLDHRTGARDMSVRNVRTGWGGMSALTDTMQDPSIPGHPSCDVGETGSGPPAHTAVPHNMVVYEEGCTSPPDGQA